MMQHGPEHPELSQTSEGGGEEARVAERCWTLERPGGIPTLERGNNHYSSGMQPITLI